MLKERLKNPFVQQYLIEIIFPLIGYFFFSWSLFIIGLYYIIDHLCAQLLFFRRLKWMNKSKAFSFLPLIICVVLTVVFIAAEVLMLVYLIHVNKEQEIAAIQTEFLLFARQELWLLLPLLLFVYHVKDQFTFYVPRHYLKYDYVKSVKMNLIGMVIQFVLLLLGGWMWISFKLNDMVVILIFLLLKIAYDLTLGKKLVANTLKVGVN